MATFIKRGGKILVQIRRKGFPTLCRSFHLKSDAQEWARHMETKADRGELPTPVKVLDAHKVSDVLKRYRDEITVKKRSANTEVYILDAFLRLPMANLTLAQITATHFSKYREMRLKAVKPGTVNRELSIVKHAFDVAEREWGIPIKLNPLSKLKKLKACNARTRRLLPEEQKTLEEGITQRNAHVLPLMRLALATGMRRGEMLRMRWDEIDFEKRTLHIPLTKNGHARTIPLSSDALQILDGLKSNDAELVFPFSDNAAKLAWQRLVDKTGVKDLHFHDLRHEAISRFFERGLSVPEVALISGHRDFRMLFRYTHLKAEDIAGKLN